MDKTTPCNMIFTLDDYKQRVKDRLNKEYPSITFNFNSIKQSYANGLDITEAVDICYNETIKEMNANNMTYFQY